MHEAGVVYFDLLSNVVLGSRPGHEHDDNRGEERADAGGDEGLLPCLQNVSRLYTSSWFCAITYQANSNESRASVPTCQGELVREPIQRQVVPGQLVPVLSLFVPVST